MSIAVKIIVSLFTIQFLLCNTARCQKLKIGDLAPTFEVVEVHGDTIKLENYKGQKLYMAFFRYAGCPVCNFRVHELIENYDSIQNRGYTLIAIYESDKSTLSTYLKETDIPFIMIGDSTLKLYKKYGVERSFWKTMASAFNKQPKEAMKKGNMLYSIKYKRDGSLTRIPADFLIDENGILTTVHYGKNIGDHLPILEILK